MSLFSFRRQPEEIAEEAVLLEMPEPEPVPAVIGPYANSQEHLWQELARVDQLIRAQTARWQATIAASKPEQHWGMLHVTDAEVETYIQAPFTTPDQLPGSLSNTMAAFWQRSQELAGNIQTRLAETPDSIGLRLPRLQTLFGLDDLERDVILLCLLPELDGRYRRLYGYLMDDCSRNLPTVDLLLPMLQPEIDDPGYGRRAFSAASPLLAHHLVRLTASGFGQEPLSMQSVQLDGRIANYLLSQDEVDGRLEGLATFTKPRRTWADLMMDEERLDRLQALAGWWEERRQAGMGSVTLLLHGPYGSDRLAAAEAICAATETSLLIANLPAQIPADWPLTVALCYREAALADAAVYWAGGERLLAAEQSRHLWHDLVDAAEGYEGLTFLASQIAWEPANRFRERPFLRLEFPQPGYEVRYRIWLAYLPLPDAFVMPVPETAVLAELLANSFQFTTGQILDALSLEIGPIFAYKSGCMTRENWSNLGW